MLLYMTAKLAQVLVSALENMQASLLTCCGACCAFAATASLPPFPPNPPHPILPWLPRGK